MSFQTNPPRRISLEDILKQQDQERGLELMPLERDLLIKRVKAGGHSGQFLADAFLSAYRTERPFQHSLGELTRLDAEGFRLFHQILHIRYIPGWWNDQALFDIEHQVKIMMTKEEQ